LRCLFPVQKQEGHALRQVCQPHPIRSVPLSRAGCLFGPCLLHTPIGRPVLSPRSSPPCRNAICPKGAFSPPFLRGMRAPVLTPPCPQQVHCARPSLTMLKCSTHQIVACTQTPKRARGLRLAKASVFMKTATCTHCAGPPLNKSVVCGHS
jgi:hypothetical protein